MIGKYGQLSVSTGVLHNRITFDFHMHIAIILQSFSGFCTVKVRKVVIINDRLPIRPVPIGHPPRLTTFTQRLLLERGQPRSTS